MVDLTATREATVMVMVPTKRINSSSSSQRREVRQRQCAEAEDGRRNLRHLLLLRQFPLVPSTAEACGRRNGGKGGRNRGQAGGPRG